MQNLSGNFPKYWRFVRFPQKYFCMFYSVKSTLTEKFISFPKIQSSNTFISKKSWREIAGMVINQLALIIFFGCSNKPTLEVLLYISYSSWNQTHFKKRQTFKFKSFKRIKKMAQCLRNGFFRIFICNLMRRSDEQVNCDSKLTCPSAIDRALPQIAIFKILKSLQLNGHDLRNKPQETGLLSNIDGYHLCGYLGLVRSHLGRRYSRRAAYAE